MTASFQLATNRGADYKGTVRHIASRTEVADDTTIGRPVDA